MHWPEIIHIVSLHFHCSKVIMLCRVIVCGGGIIGSAIAYYLTLKGVATTVVERAAIACASSGVPGSCLFNWHDQNLIGSFALLHVRVVLLDTNQILASSCHKAHVTITEHAPVFTIWAFLANLLVNSCVHSKHCEVLRAHLSSSIARLNCCMCPLQPLAAGLGTQDKMLLLAKCVDCPSWTTAAQVHTQ